MKIEQNLLATITKINRNRFNDELMQQEENVSCLLQLLLKFHQNKLSELSSTILIFGATV